MNNSEASTAAEIQAAHEARMKEMQLEMRAKMRAAREKKGLLMVHTGNGKGKSTAAFGMLTRALAHGFRCGVVQFIKSSPDAVEKMLRGPLLEWHAVGDGFTWDTQDREGDMAKCREGWAHVLRWLADPEVDFILMDELNVVLSYNYLDTAEVVAALRNRREGLHVVCTGRGAPELLLEVADLVTEMREVKHPFKAGVQAQRGVEF